MKKPAMLRKHLTASTPELKRSPDKLSVFVDKGNVVTTGAGSLSYEYRFTLKLIVLDFSDKPETIFVPLLAWLKANQLEIFESPDLRKSAIRFEAELLNNESVDLSIEVDLSERIIVQRVTDAQETLARYEISDAGEPALAGVAGDKPEHWEIWALGEMIASWDIPARRT